MPAFRNLASDDGWGGSAVFFDNVDQGACGMQIPQNCDFTNINLTHYQAGLHKMLTTLVSKLNGVGIVPILSLDNLLPPAPESAASTTARPARPCAIPESDLVSKLSQFEWIRFYEIFPGAFFPAGEGGWGPPWGGPEVYAENIANAIEEGKRGVGNVLHNLVGACPGNVSEEHARPRPGRLGGNIEFAIASYLVVMSPGTVLSVSRGWYDSDFCWHREFDIDYGTPLGPAVRVGLYAWARNYTRCHVQIDVSQVPAGKAPWPTGKGSVVLLA